MKRTTKNSFIFLIIGFIFVSISFNISENENFIYKLISEGAMVGGWVSFYGKQLSYNFNKMASIEK